MSLEGVEKLAQALASQAQHAATAIPDEQRGGTIVLFSTDPSPTRERLQQGARTFGLPEIAVPRTLVAVDALPLLGTGKIDYAGLRTRAIDGARSTAAA